MYNREPRLAERLEQKVQKVRRDLERRGVLETVRSELARGKALEFLIEHARVVDEEGNVIDITVPEGQPTAGEDRDESTEEAVDSDAGGGMSCYCGECLFSSCNFL